MASKDPAFLFYASDFLTGVSDLTFEERGQYITLLCLQHQKSGRLSRKAVAIAVPNATADVMAKFTEDEEGLLYNKRLETEMIKRAEHSEKQRQRALDGWKKRKGKNDATANATALPLEDEDENENEDINKSIDEIYKLYPSKCVVKNSNTGKSSKKDKDKIKTLLKNYSKDDLIIKINWYVNECRTNKVYMKNFNTFLNNLPDTEAEEPKNLVPLFRCTHRFGNTKDYEVATEEEAKQKYHDYCNCYPDEITKLR